MTMNFTSQDKPVTPVIPASHEISNSKNLDIVYSSKAITEYLSKILWVVTELKESFEKASPEIITDTIWSAHIPCCTFYDLLEELELKLKEILEKDESSKQLKLELFDCLELLPKKSLIELIKQEKAKWK